MVERHIREAAMPAIDFKRTRKDLYAPKPGVFTRIDVPALPFLMIDGAGPPEGEAFASVFEAIFSVAYGLKFMSKVEHEADFVVPPLEGLWWADRMDSFYDRAKEEWLWRLMIPQPDWITPDMFARAVVGASRKKKGGANLEKLRLETFAEGLCVQTLYTGSYDDEGPTIAALHQFIEDNGLMKTGHHHEIYLSDPRRVEPAKLKTILRQPVKAL